jgi:hypothetical protein
VEKSIQNSGWTDCFLSIESSANYPAWKHSFAKAAKLMRKVTVTCNLTHSFAMGWKHSLAAFSP